MGDWLVEGDPNQGGGKLLESDLPVEGGTSQGLFRRRKSEGKGGKVMVLEWKLGKKMVESSLEYQQG